MGGCCDIVYIKGNPNSGSIEQHKLIDKSILKLIEDYTYKVICSNESNKNYLNKIPKAKIYIGFSRGSRYLKKLSNNVLKLSIGGISGSGISLFVNEEDKVLSGDISISSMEAHFTIKEKDNDTIKVLISSYIRESLSPC
ncbi:MAG: hypothetical protein KAQ94_00890 [Arcobacteraceae bacterium]|nr:hypothetical protein [Arcobacteraceae bacterium]